MRNVSPSSPFLSFSKFSAASSRWLSASMFLITMQSPFSLRKVWLMSPADGSPFGKLIGVILMRCLIFHKRALFSGMFLTTATFGVCSGGKLSF